MPALASCGSVRDVPRLVRNPREDRAIQQRSSGPLIYSAVMLVVLVAFVFLGDNGVAYLTVLLGVPIASGLLAGLQRIRFWHAVIGCLAVVVLDLSKVAADHRFMDRWGSTTGQMSSSCRWIPVVAHRLQLVPDH
jgi:hypothetical protein